MADDDEEEEREQNVFARRAAITAGFTTHEVDTTALYANEFKPPFKLMALDEHRFPSRSFLPLEAQFEDQRGKDVTRVLVLKGNDEDEDLQVMIKFTLEPYEDAMTARGGTEKQMVQGLHRFLRDHAADEWHLTLDEADLESLEDDKGEYPTGTYSNMTVEWLGKMCQNPALRDSYISWLESGQAKKGAHLTANQYHVLFKVGMRIMKRTGGTKKWPSVTEFIVWFYRGFPVTFKAKFRAVHPSGTKVTVRQIMSYMQNLEDAEKTSKRRYDGQGIERRAKYPPHAKKARRSGRGPRHQGGYHQGGRGSPGRKPSFRGGDRYIKGSGRGRGQGRGQRRQNDRRHRDENRGRGDHQRKGHDEGRRSRRDRDDEDMHLAEAEHQEEDADEVNAEMESEECASPYQESSESVPSVEEDCLDDQYCTDAVGKTGEKFESLVLEDAMQHDLFETALAEESAYLSNTLPAEEAAYIANLDLQDEENDSPVQAEGSETKSGETSVSKKKAADNN